MVVRAFLLALVCLLAACGGRERVSMLGDGGVLPMDGGTVDVDGGTMTGTDAGGTMVMHPLVDPTCVDGMYSEVLPNPDADISDLVASYSGDYQTFINEVLERRYPLGAELVRRGRADSMIGDCVELFIGTTAGSIPDLMRRIKVIVHECGHLADFGVRAPGSNYYIVREDLTFMCPMGDTTSRGGQTFARSMLTGDAYSPMLPGDSYRGVYLEGRGSEQGFNSVMEEALQYTNSIAIGYALLDQIPPGGSVSDKDGILTFLWYIERYLKMARESVPSAYAHISGNACWRQMILTVWGRAWLYLDTTETFDELGINEDALLSLVMAPELVAEIEMIRQLECP